MLTLALDRPDRRNALDGPWLADLVARLRDRPETPEPLLLTAVGKVFCAGLDFDFLGRSIREHGSAGPALRPLLDLYDALLAWPGPTVSVVQSAALGGGFALAMCCDVVLAGPRAWFWLPEGPLQPLASVTLPYLQRRLRPDRRDAAGSAAIEWFGRKIDAAEALELGLADASDDAAGQDVKAAAAAALDRFDAGRRATRTIDRPRLATLLTQASSSPVATAVAAALPG